MGLAKWPIGRRDDVIARAGPDDIGPSGADEHVVAGGPDDGGCRAGGGAHGVSATARAGAWASTTTDVASAATMLRLKDIMFPCFPDE